MTNELEEVPAVKLLRLEPGDVLVVETDTILSNESSRRIGSLIEREFPGHRVVVLDAGTRLKVARGAA